MILCLKMASCNATCIRPKNHKGECWHCDVNEPMPEDVKKVLEVTA
jgi:hypothetical protein